MVIRHDFFEDRVEKLFHLADTIEAIFTDAGLDYRIVGGLAVYLYVESAAPDAGRLTRDIDIVVRREDLQKIASAAEKHNFSLRHAAGVDMLVNNHEPSARGAVHLVFSGEKVRADYLTDVPPLGQQQVLRGLRLLPLDDLIQMKLTSYRLKDQTHLRDLLDAGLVDDNMESRLSPPLAERLTRIRNLE
ncbi:MAG: hypothetical protein NW208_14050 [Bryobacter sp.]|nr:hypothetical protein [Bryobacter sp.]